jgi:hypothetical protein
MGIKMLKSLLLRIAISKTTKNVKNKKPMTQNSSKIKLQKINNSGNQP